VRFSAELDTNLLQIAGRLAHIVRDQEDHTGWLTATIPFESLFEARERLLALGGAVEVLAPRALRLSMIDYAEQILKRYQP
jgi:predicted DNA-binding transcriptional regulator YafY